MKIVIVNYRYFISGGPERYLFNLKNLLEEHGHTVIPFSITYTKNEESEYSQYFATPLSNEDEVFFHEQTWNLISVFKTLERSFYSGEVFTKLSKLINDTKPDFAIVLHYLRKLSPSVLDALTKAKVPFIVRLSDFEMICPNAHLLRKNNVCELCVKGSVLNSIRYKCVQNSYGASIINYLAVKYHEMRGYLSTVKYFVVPSKFTINKMVEGGWPGEKFVYLPTFVSKDIREISRKREQIIFIGRVVKAKGIHLLFEALKMLKDDSGELRFSVIIVGEGEQDYIAEIQKYIGNNKINNIKFVGFKNKDEINELLKQSLFCVIPSIWYDNMPNVLLESFAAGTPVVVPNMGSFCEIVTDNYNGMLFAPNNTQDLKEKINYLLKSPELCYSMGRNSLEYIEKYHSPETHYNKIIQIYNNMKKENYSE